MNENIVLLLGGDRADLPSNFSVLYNLKMEELSNPTVVKNSYSKTVTLPGTANNNKIFGFFYRGDRMTYLPLSQGTGAGFDASKRLGFQLFVNGVLEEEGYLQLNDVTRQGADVVYKCTLYGGLGDFFYSLSKADDGNNLTLADLDWGIDGASNKETEMDFVINKDTVASAWTYLNSNAYAGTSLWDTINFIPLNSGIPDDEFDADKVLINTREQSIFPTSGTGETSAYTAYHGYVMGTMDKEYDWIAMRDLRSYLQRPCLKTKRFFDAICSSGNNGGYKVELDPAFFNPNNPYFADTYMTLPPMGTDDNDAETYRSTEVINNYEVGSVSNMYDVAIPVIVDGDISSDLNGIMNFSAYPFGNIEMSVDVSLTALTEYTGVEKQNTNGLREYNYVNNDDYLPANYEEVKLDLSMYMVQLIAYDADSWEAVGGSNIHRFASHSPTRYETYGLNEIENYCNYDPAFNAPYTTLYGDFYYDPILGKSVFKDEEGFDKWRLTINLPKAYNRLNFVLRVTKLYCGYKVKYYYISHQMFNRAFTNWDGTKDNVTVGSYTYGTTYYGNTKTGLVGDGTMTLSISNALSSNSLITKRKLFKDAPTPVEILLSYTKMFGLYWEKDKYDKVVYCRMRNTQYTGEIVDIDDKIDYSRPYSITPVRIKSHYYEMKADTPETYYSELYKDNYGAEFGAQKINTNSNFDNDITELYDNNVFTTLVTAREYNAAYSNYYDKTDISPKTAPAFLVGGVEVDLYKNGAVDETTAVTVNANKIDFSRTKDWYYVKGYDFMERPVSYELDGNTKKSVDSEFTLLFFNGFQDCKTFEGDGIKFWLTDDTNTMMLLNENRCWLWTDTTQGYEGTIARQVSRLPIFSRYSSGRNAPVVSLDFGTPKELYVSQHLGEDTDIYSQYWRKYLTDQFSVNTKTVTAYVRFDKSLYKDCLRKFYYFDNSIWMLNEVQEYNVCADGVTKLVFIKIQDMTNYTNGQTTYNTI